MQLTRTLPSRLALRCLPALALLATALPAHADCLLTYRSTELDASLDAAEAAYAAVDVLAFAEQVDAATLELACLGDPVNPAQAARFDRIAGIRLYAAGHQQEATATLQRARALDPDYHFPDALLPPGHALRVAYDALPTASPRGDRVPEARGAATWFDGVSTRFRPDGPTVFQLVTPQGSATETTWLTRDVALPAYDRVPHLRNTLLLAAGGLALGAAGTYVASAFERNQFDTQAPTGSTTRLTTLQKRTNVMFALSIALSVGATGTAITAIGAGDG